MSSVRQMLPPCELRVEGTSVAERVNHRRHLARVPCEGLVEGPGARKRLIHNLHLARAARPAGLNSAGGRRREEGARDALYSLETARTSLAGLPTIFAQTYTIIEAPTAVLRRRARALAAPS